MNSRDRLIILVLVIGIIFGFAFGRIFEIKVGIRPKIKRVLKKVYYSTSKPKKTNDTLELCYFEWKKDLVKLEDSKTELKLSRKYASDGKHSLRCVFPDGGGNVSFYGTLPKDWRGYKYLKFDVYSEDDNIPLSLFVADTNNKSYYDRYNKERLSLNKGWNHIEIPVSEIDKKLILDRINHLVIFLWRVKGEHVLYIDNIRLTNIENGENSNNPAEAMPVKISIYPSKEKHKISRLLYGSNLCAKMETDYLIWKFIKDAGITCFRFPGGGSQGWRWKTGSGDFSKKMKNMPLAKIDYLIKFCQKTNTKIIMQVNIESGTKEEAAELVEYMNKTVNFRVDYWELGNEVYGNWDKGYTTPHKYAQLIKEYCLAMKAVDPTIKIGADWGGRYYDRVKWDQTIIKEAGDYIDFISYHWYPNHTNKKHAYEGRTHPTPQELMANALEIPNIVNRVHEIIDQYAPERKGKIEVTFLEWDGSWDAPSSDPNPPYAQGIMQWSLANAIFYVDCLGLFAENGVSVSTHYSFQECMFGLIRGWNPAEGWGGMKWDTVTIRPKAFAIELFSKHFGDILIENKVENSPYYNKNGDYWAGSYTGKVPYISCYASKSADSKKLGIILVNKHADQNLEVNLSIDKAFKVKKEANAWLLTGPDLGSQNDGNPGIVRIKQLDLIKISNKFKHTVPAHSVVAIEIELL